MAEKVRCEWSLGSEKYMAYHDEEWGVPVYDDKVLFEFLILEGAQAGLSWSTILNRREGYKQAFSNWDVEKVAGYSEQKIQMLLDDVSIIRNKLKIRGAVNNAARFMQVQQEFGSFSNYLWEFVNHKPVINSWKRLSEIPATTPVSDQLSKDLKKRGFKFTGSTIMYAYMQACGLVHDHVVDCFCYKRAV